MIILALALALADEQTDCYRVGNTVHCNSTTSGSGLQDVGALIRSSRDAAPVYQGPTSSDLAAMAARNVRQRVGKLIAAGKCPDAEEYALKAGDLDLAAQVKAYCASR